MSRIEEIQNIFPEQDSIPQEFNIQELHQKEYLINGKLQQWDGPSHTVYSPVFIKKGSNFEKRVLGSYPVLTKNESSEALKSALAAYDKGRGQWPTMRVEERIICIHNFIEEMRGQRETIVKLIMWEIGKNHRDSLKEFDRTVDYLVDTIDALKDLDRASSRFVIEQGIMAQIRRSPLGVVLCMGPFNYPLNETFITLLPALIMGNVVIFKPPKLGVLLYQPLLKAFQKCFPKGVVNTLYGGGKEITGPLMESGKIDALAFIGSSQVADILKHKHPKPHRLRSVLGLEAKNAAIILADADLDLATQECILGSLSFNGQRCTALKILFVHKSIADEFNTRLIRELESQTIGMPWDNANITPLPEEGKPEYLKSCVEDAESKGARIINECGGTINNSFYYPAVLYPVKDTMKIFHEEQFGPVIPIMPFEELEEPLEYIINSDYGQQVSIFGSNSQEIAELIDPLVNQLCRVNINSQCQRGPDIFPFTGRKDSAEGTLSVSDALRVFTIRSLVAAKGNDMNKKIVKEIINEDRSNFLHTDFIL